MNEAHSTTPTHTANAAAPSDGHDEGMVPVYLDDDGAPLAPEVEGSVLMALGIASQAVACGDALDTVDYREDEASFEAQRLAALQWLNADAQQHVPAPSAASDEVRQACEGEEQGDYDDGDAEVEEGMGAPQFSREVTAEDEPWVLERILRRRVHKAEGGEREVQYCCKWKYYVEPTWESREVLEDEGFKGACDAFDGVKAEQTGGVQSKRGRPPCQFSHGLDIDENCELENIFGQGHLEKMLRDKFSDCGVNLFDYMSVAIKSRVEAFKQTWRSLAETHRPVLLFHGTQSKNILSIVKNGLDVHRNRPKLPEFACRDVGINTTARPLSQAYSCYTNVVNIPYDSPADMFVCIGLVNNGRNDDPTVKNVYGHGAEFIFYDSALIIPIGLVGFSQITQYTALEKRSHVYPLPRRSFNRVFDPSGSHFVAEQTHMQPPAVKEAEANAAAAGEVIPTAYKGLGIFED